MSYNRKEFNKVLNDRFCNISNSIKLISSYEIANEINYKLSIYLPIRFILNSFIYY